ncbi:P-loop containing nucleoside triphosphate hydrolase protein [Myriangium duriaei CBS 260.36]|uniref:Origin recognition complex subunit 1 n=1 Tax=Myriangium duriaei CBS 260.36 TaxID=1168546 RepID=A0A9P4J660_9PEZI|nr:P-loop containing nucleoside triphosphate hydrolase protein [Myriangium duriaei CBS 260.36]
MVVERRRRSKTEKALQILHKGAVLREDSDDELGVEDHPWEWIYDSGDNDQDGDKEKAIVGAKMGTFECAIGDTVLLKAAGNEAWVAILTGFSEGEIEDDEGEMIWSKKANFLWFSSEREIKNGPRKRTDALPNELYITANMDENSLATINGKATILSHAAFEAQHPSGKINRGTKAYGKTFVCRRGCNPRTTSYTEEFVWEATYRGQQDIESLAKLVQSQTVKTRKRKAVSKDLDEFVAPDVDDPITPRKRRKTTAVTTPKSRGEKKTKPSANLLTPTHRRIVEKKPLEFTPLGTRVIPDVLSGTPHQQARSTLHVSAVPTSLPCREAEFSAIYTHLESAISTSTGSTIYISGTPGTGKTATVREVVASLNIAVQNEELDDFIFVEINGMKVTDPHQSYSLLWQALKGQRVSPSHALELLEREFSTPSPRRTPCVVLMDELDQLVTRNQGVMYNFFNWPQLRHSRLIVLAVANTMDLPERTLSNKISSRLGLTRITFAGYTHTQLIKIIESRLQSVRGAVVDPDAVQFAARKVAAVSGDARRALDVCRRAVEIAEADVPADGVENVPPTPSKTPAAVVPAKGGKEGTVSIATIKRAIAEATATPLAAYLRSLPLSSKLLLAALLARIRRSGLQEVVLADVVDDARRIGLTAQSPAVEKFLLAPDEAVKEMAWLASCQDGEMQGKGKPGGAGLLGTPGRRGRHAIKRVVERRARVKGVAGAAVELAEAGVLGLENRRGERVGRVRLGVGEEDVRSALREDEDCRGLGFDA